MVKTDYSKRIAGQEMERLALKVAATFLETESQGLESLGRLVSTLQALERLAGSISAAILAHGRGGWRLEASADGPVSGSRTRSVCLLASAEAAGEAFTQKAQPQWVSDAADGAGCHLLVKIADQQTKTLFLALSFDNPSAVCRARATRLLPDLLALLRAQVDLDTRVREVEAQRVAAVEALDHGECGVIAVRTDRSVVFANQAASQHLDAEFGLRLWRGLVRPADRQHASRFEAAIDDVIERARDEPSKRARAHVMLLSRKGDGQSTIVVIAPTRSASAIGEDGPEAAAIIYVFQPTLGVVRGLDALCQLHGLSRVESRLIGNLICGMTITEAAAEMRIKIDTARAYLKQVFAKTGTHRQTELVSLMTRYLLAVRGDFDFQPA